ncbi:MAG: fused MFS/spermidine synthase [Lentisphaeria bacterium]|nr:fused MFS/spermidine synthase [Lentisphaeria bacterium]
MESHEPPPLRAVWARRLCDLCLTCLVFTCGWVLMMLEMLGARMLAPSFGTDIQVWGSVIGVFLLALSLGYYLGGRLSTAFPKAVALTGLLLPCALWIGVLPWLHRPLNTWLFDFWVVHRDGGEQWGALAAAILLFLIPSVLLGTVSPFAIRLAATDVGSVGERAGLLYAVSTLGSFLGCMVTSFWLIVWLGVDRILQLHAVLLAAAAVAFLAAWHALKRGLQP